MWVTGPGPHAARVLAGPALRQKSWSLALREGARLAQFFGAGVVLLAVVEYLAVEIEDALAISEAVEIRSTGAPFMDGPKRTVGELPSPVALNPKGTVGSGT